MTHFLESYKEDSHYFEEDCKFRSMRKDGNFLSLIPTRVLGLLQSVSSVAQSCPTLCDPMNRSKPGLPVHHQLPESTQTRVH